MGRKVILVILDGLNYQVASECMGFLMGAVRHYRGDFHPLTCELPSLSRPLYETILTGQTPYEHGVIHNDVVRSSNQKSIFSLARQADKTTAAAAYSWFSELYVNSPFNVASDRILNDKDQLIQHGIFYWENHYPDSHLFSDSESLRRNYAPDFLLVHPMNIDDAGHGYGLLSKEYRDAAKESDKQLSQYLSRWLDDGYQVVITSDHGMDEHCGHGGTTSPEREVPLWLFGESFKQYRGAALKQLHICGLVCETMGLEQHGKPLPSSVSESDQS